MPPGYPQASVPPNALLGACMAWEMLGGNTAVDVDVSCVGIDRRGKVLMDETVYFADLTNTNGAMRHSGDEREGDEDLGQGDDEIVYLNLADMPSEVCLGDVDRCCVLIKFNEM